MTKTISLGEKTLWMLEYMKEETKSASYDEVIRKMISNFKTKQNEG